MKTPANGWRQEKSAENTHKPGSELSFAFLHHLATTLLFAVLFVSPAQSQETRRQYLSGHGKDDAIPWKFMCTSGPQSGYWTNLPVPSNWELHGFGSMNYHKDPTNAWDEKGLYQHDFRVPKDWAGRRIFLVFDGVMTDTRAALNGQSVGPMHQGSFYRFKYEVTDWIKTGATNRLEVTVAKHSANNSVNRAERTADYWVFGGIYRPVYLEAVPARFIERVAIDARANGDFAMDVFVDSGVEGALLEAQILGPNGKPVGAPFTTKLTGPRTSLSTHVESPRAWSAETPQLYQVAVTLKDGKRILHRFRQRFGFRTMEVRDGDGLYVNGRRVILKGADRHSFWPDSGRCLSEAVHRLDINTMKDMNMNAVRMSHYPPDEQFLELCDELGLYVLDELAGWHAYYDTEVGHKLVREMVTRDANHPCILFWDNGNEGGFNTELDGDFGLWDPQHRRVLHPWSPFNGVNTSHYLTYEQATAACAGRPSHYRNGAVIANTNDPIKYIYMPTEFQHGLYDGGAGAGLEDYWSLMLKSKLLGGGFIWVLEDDGAKRPDTGKLDVAGNQAPDGIVGPYREREGSFYTIKELWSPLVLTPVRLTAPAAEATEDKAVFALENRYSFTDAHECKFTWELRRFHRPNEASSGFRVIAHGPASAPSIPPGQTGELTLGLPAQWRQADALSIRATEPSGRELFTWVWPLAGADNFRQLLSTPSTQKVSLTETADAIEVRVGELIVRFSKQTGLLSGAQRGAKMFSLANGPRLASGTATLKGLQTKVEGSDCVVTAAFEGELDQVTWRVHGNGWVQCDYAYTAQGPKEYHGIVFDYPEQLVKRKKWLGNGPYRVWKNRLRGPTLNVWENDYNNTITGWTDWVYPEFKGCFANVRWMQLDTTEGLITAILGQDDLFVQVLTPEFPAANLGGKTIPHLPQAGLAFLHAIPPMGSKFQEPAKTGPQGQPNVASGRYAGSLNFYFGALTK
jgi:hypothetical protein